MPSNTDDTPTKALVETDSGSLVPPPEYEVEITEETLAERIGEYQEAGKLPDAIPRWYARFLCALAEKPIVTRACAIAGIRSTKTAYRHKAQWAGFHELWEEALLISVDALESSAWDAARYDNSMKMFLLNAHRFRKQQADSMTLPDGAREISFTLVIDDEEERQVL